MNGAPSSGARNPAGGHPGSDATLFTRLLRHPGPEDHVSVRRTRPDDFIVRFSR